MATAQAASQEEVFIFPIAPTESFIAVDLALGFLKNLIRDDRGNLYCDPLPRISFPRLGAQTLALVPLQAPDIGFIAQNEADGWRAPHTYAVTFAPGRATAIMMRGDPFARQLCGNRPEVQPLQVHLEDAAHKRGFFLVDHERPAVWFRHIPVSQRHAAT